jgi:aspartyl protease family protein
MTRPQPNISRSPHCTRFRLLALIIVLFGFTGISGTVTAENLRRQLETLAADRDFRIEGIDLIGDEDSASPGTKIMADRINLLLENYNFVITRDSQDRIAQLTIVGLRVKPAVRPSFPELIKTERHQSEHYVEAVLTGPNGQNLALKFMVDTGASTLVLPQSLATSLGYTAEELQTVHVQTANGKTMGLSAMLQSVRVGEAETDGVAVTFVDDHLLGGRQLLGMSFLGRFRMTIDGGSGELLLEKQSN